MLEIREEATADRSAIREVVSRSCGPREADLVDRLRANGASLLSLVAVADGKIVGHIFYSPASVGNVRGAALAPMGVAPEYQRRGIGSRLVESGNQVLAERGCPFIVVLGHATYYPRFGFVPASTYNIGCVWKVPDDVFMVRVFDDEQLHGVSGIAMYREEFLAG
jgi:putative acetyltransferase